MSLDLSWCRRLTDEALGMIVDSCLSLKLLKLFGCTQITEAFLNGHSNPMVRIIGCKTGPVLEHLDALEPQENPLRYSPLTSFCWSTTYYIPPGCLTFLLASLLYIKNHPVSSSVTSFFLAHGILKTKHLSHLDCQQKNSPSVFNTGPHLGFPLFMSFYLLVLMQDGMMPQKIV